MGKGAGVGAALFLLGLAAAGIGMIGGAALGALHHKGLRLDEADRDRAANELNGGKAAVGVLTPAADASAISVQLADLGGTAEVHAVSDEALECSATVNPTS